MELVGGVRCPGSVPRSHILQHWFTQPSYRCEALLSAPPEPDGDQAGCVSWDLGISLQVIDTDYHQIKQCIISEYLLRYSPSKDASPSDQEMCIVQLSYLYYKKA